MLPKTTLAADLARLRLLGTDPCLPIPPDAAALWQRGQVAGGQLRTLYWLRTPLSPGQGGGWTPEGDVWVWACPAQPARARTHLLHEIAHGLRNRPPAPTIDAHWDEEAATWQQARALAVAWDCAELLPDAALTARLAEGERYRALYHATAALAGTADLGSVRGAFAALLGLQAEAGWDAATFEAALWGEDPDGEPAPPEHGVLPATWAILEFDRGQMRAGWRVGAGVGIDFGRLARPPTAYSVGLLRAALGRAQQEPAHAPRGALCWLPLAEARDLAAVIGAANALLLAHPATYAQARWTCYADAAQAARIYHLEVEYALPGDPPMGAALWILVAPSRQRAAATEAALQQYIRGWQRVQPLYCAPLVEGLRRVWDDAPMAPVQAPGKGALNGSWGDLARARRGGD
jgi:hypothetical protein